MHSNSILLLGAIMGKEGPGESLLRVGLIKGPVGGSRMVFYVFMMHWELSEKLDFIKTNNCKICQLHSVLFRLVLSQMFRCYPAANSMEMKLSSPIFSSRRPYLEEIPILGENFTPTRRNTIFHIRRKFHPTKQTCLK